ncbi:MAG TPA: DUF1329 domain-containing protein [Verrucomicrobiae bacterium]|nr:DUF1329 domain-containing protein [Verrucomicrobiae bacterium]
MQGKIAVALLVAVVSLPLAAKVTPEEAAKLGTELTPVGAEKGGNADGSIPAWTPHAKKGALKNEYPTAPFDNEKPLFTITGANLAQYGAKLTEGHKYLLKTYPSYKMNVYPSHRVVAWPDEIYKSTKENATKCELIGTDQPDNCTMGFPYPIPKSGAEPIWNHKLKWRGEDVRRFNVQMIVQPDGKYQQTKVVEDVTFGYASIKKPSTLKKGGETEFLRYLSETLSPPRIAGTFILVQERASTGNEGRNAWLYSPALRRIRRAPTVCCDNPYEGTDGHQFYDQVDMFNGVLERYSWKIVGKREMVVGYNANKIAGNKVKYKDIAAPKHINQELPRYELHRVWVIDATLRAGTSHTFKRRVMYLDEDGWNIVAVDNYDNNDQLYQFQEGHYVPASNILAGTTIPEVIYHFTTGRYFVTAMANEDKPNDLTVKFGSDHFTAAAVQKRSTR